MSSATEKRIFPYDPDSSLELLGGNDVSSCLDETSSQQSCDDSTFTPMSDSQAFPLAEDNVAAVAANSKRVSFHADEEAEDRSSHNLAGSGRNAHDDKRETRNVETSAEYQLTPMSLKESLESLDNISRDSEVKLDFNLDVPRLMIDEHLKDDSCDEQGMGSQIESLIPGENRDISTLFPWRESSVDKSEIPSDVPKSASSDISDLGNRVFYASLRAKNRKLTAKIDLKGNSNRAALQNLFFKELIRIHAEKKGFFPRALLASLVTEECVVRELTMCLSETHNPSQIQEYARKICEESSLPKENDDYRPPQTKSFKKIFVILVLIEKTQSVCKFLDEEVNDLDLPLIKVQKTEDYTQFDLRLVRNKEKELECFHNWSQLFIIMFEDFQWMTVSPFFHKGTRKDVQHFPLQDCIVLPFTTDSRRSKGNPIQMEFEGGYGRVFKVDIHPDHHNFDLPNNQAFAVKRLNSPNKVDFRQEVEMLKLFSDDTHPHLISLLATYEQFGVYYLIFPWADSDLIELWKLHKPMPSFDLKTIMWVAKQCEGIADGLVRIHKYQTSNSKLQNGPTIYCRHGDIKPENVLWFDDGNGGILKISDFGLSDSSTTHSKSYKPRSRVAMSPSYRPPECDILGSIVGPSYDIWTLGCLYSEFITWLLGGWLFVKKFEKQRMSHDYRWSDMSDTRSDTFFELRYEWPKDGRPKVVGAVVKPSVRTFLRNLHEHDSCTDFLHNFINMVRFDMLVVKASDPQEIGRLTSQQIHRMLTLMLWKCQDLDYASKPAPWTKHSQASNRMVTDDELDSAARLLHRETFDMYEKLSHEQSQQILLAVPRRKSGRHH